MPGRFQNFINTLYMQNTINYFAFVSPYRTHSYVVKRFSVLVYYRTICDLRLTSILGPRHVAVVLQKFFVQHQFIAVGFGCVALLGVVNQVTKVSHKYSLEHLCVVIALRRAVFNQDAVPVTNSHFELVTNSSIFCRFSWQLTIGNCDKINAMLFQVTKIAQKN